MAIQLRPNESIVYPQPYEPSQHNPLIITNERLIQVNEVGGILNLENRQVTGVGRGIDQRIFAICALLMLLALPAAIYGVYNYLHASDVLSKFKEPPKAKIGSKKEKADVAAYKAAKGQRILGIVFVVVGAGFGAGAYLLFKKRFTVVFGGAGRTQTVKTKDKMQQTQIIMTIQAMVNTAKQQVAAQAAVQKPPMRR